MKGSPRHSPSASENVCAARSGSPSSSCSVPRVTSQLEPLGVDLDVLRDQSVPARGGFDPRRCDEPAQPHDAPGNDLRPRGGWVVAPQRRREGMRPTTVRTQADRERSHHRTIARSQWNPAVVECQRSQYAHLHGATVTPTPTAVKTAVIGLLPNRRAPLSC